MPFKRSSLLPLLALLLLLLFFLPLPVLARAKANAEVPRDARQWLADRLAQLAADRRIAPARAGVEVFDLASGETLVKLRSNEHFNIASNAKLVTVAAALSFLGPELRLKTVLYGGTRRDGSVMEGDLYLKGFGDPSITEKDLWQLTSDIYDRGIRRIKGGLIIDESYFDGQRLAPLYAQKNTDQWYRPPNGALSLENNAVAIRVSGGFVAGQRARVLLRPHSSYLQLVNRSITVGGIRRSWVLIHTRPGKNTTIVEVQGRVRLGYRSRLFRRRIEDPGLFTAVTFIDLLHRRGVHLDRIKVRRGQVPPRSRPMASHYSQPLAVLLRSANKQSNNFMAEQVLKVMGAEVFGQPGTWTNGLKAVAHYLDSLQIPQGSYTMKNGSGLYDSTRFSPHQMVRVLHGAATSFKIGSEFIASLSLAGADGTMGHRLLGTGAERYIRAKTGTLANVIALSGFAGAASTHRMLIFAIFFNDLPTHKLVGGRAVADEMAASLVAFLERKLEQLVWPRHGDAGKPNIGFSDLQ